MKMTKIRTIAQRIYSDVSDDSHCTESALSPKRPGMSQLTASAGESCAMARIMELFSRSSSHVVELRLITFPNRRRIPSVM